MSVLQSRGLPILTDNSFMSQNEFEIPGICQKIILHPNYETYEFNFWYVYSFNMSVIFLYKLGLNYN